MFQKATGIVISGGTFVNETHHTSRGMDILMEWVATSAFHNSDELYDAPKCHPHTRVAVLEEIMQWVGGSESARDDFMLWLFGPAGSGKSAIAKKIAELAAEKGLLIGTFFFSRTSPKRSTKDRLVATLAYQLALTIPGTRTYINDAIEWDPAIFNKDIRTQIDTLLINPLQSISSTDMLPSRNLIIIDALDECNDSQSQVVILDAISRSFAEYNLPIVFLVVSRPEIDIFSSFNGIEPLKYIHRRIALDNTYEPDRDIRRFFSDKFAHIKRNHPLRSTIPISWPTQKMLDKLVYKSSGQFIYAATVVRFVESSRHRPSASLDAILGILPPGKINPFAELDKLYSHVLSSVEDVELTLRVLSLYSLAPSLASTLHDLSISPELFLSLEPGDINVALINLSSIVSFDESSGDVTILHASLVDFLSDKRRSTVHYIDMASTCTDFVRRIFQYIQGPDGIADPYLFGQIQSLNDKIPKGQLRNDILNFDFNAFIKASIRHQSTRPTISTRYPYPLILTFRIWKEILAMHLDGGDQQAALDRCNESFNNNINQTGNYKYYLPWQVLNG